MANASFTWSNFLGGEWSPFAQGRMDQPKYKTALALCLNAYPIEEGALPRRPGFQHCAPTRGGVAGRIVPFVFSEVASYTVELTPGHARFFSGADLVNDNAPSSVVSISTASPAVLTVAVATTWATGDQIEFSYNDPASAAAVPYLAARQFAVTKSTTTVFSLTDPITGANIDGSVLAWATANVTATRVLDLVTPYTALQWPTVRMVQTDSGGLLLQGGVAPQVLTATPPVGGAPAAFALAVAYLQDGPYLAAPSGGLAIPSGTSGSVTVTLSYAAYSATQGYKLGDFVSASGVSYRSLVDANVGNMPASSPTDWAVVSPGLGWGPIGFIASDIGRMVRLHNTTSGWTWGKITALSASGLIDPALSGSTNFVAVSNGISPALSGSANLLFDGTISKTYSAGCQFSDSDTAVGSFTDYFRGGKNYSGATAQVITSALVYFPTDYGAAGAQINGVTNLILTAYLRAGASAPTGAGQGTRLGSVSIPLSQIAPITISSNSGASWNYVWVEIAYSVYGLRSGGYPNFGIQEGIAQIQFYGPSGAPGTAATVAILGGALTDTSACSYQAGLYSDTTGWPTTGCYQEGRLWLTGAQPNRVDSSCANTPSIFSPSNAAGTVGDGDAISGTFNSAEANPIFWLAPDLQGIVAGTQEGEYLIQSGSANIPITPANAQAHLVTKYGAANVEPKKTGLTTMFVQKYGRKLQEYLSDIFSGRFFSPNASQNAQHLTVGGLQEIAYQSGLQNIVWGRTGKGQLIGCTYNRVTLSSTAEPQYQGWHQHQLGSGRTVTSLAEGPSTDGTLSAITVVTAGATGEPYHVEIMRNLFDEEAAMTDAWFLDDAIVPSCAVTTTAALQTGLTFYGLAPHEGKHVDAFVAGLDLGTHTVTNGAIFIPYGSDPTGLFTQRYLALLTAEGNDYGDMACAVDSGMLTIPAIVGFSFTTKVQLVRPNEPAQTGAQNGPAFGKFQRITQYAIQLWKAQGISIGTDFSRMHPIKLRTPGGRNIGADQLFSGIIQDTLDDTSALGSQLCWQVTRPFPATVNAIGGFINTQDK
jgi:hypothetical protein